MGNAICSNTVDTIYDKVIFWRENLFLLFSGHSGMDAGGWCRILASNDVRTSSSDLRNANILRKLCTILLKLIQ